MRILNFFFGASLVTLHIIISPIHPVPKKKVPITLNLERTMGEKRTDFFSFEFVSRFKPILLRILGCQPSKLGGPAPTRLYLVSPSPSYPSFSLGKKRKRKKVPPPLLDRRKKEAKKMILIFYLFE